MKFERTIINPNVDESKETPVVEEPVAEVPVETPVTEDVVPVEAAVEETVPEVEEKKAEETTEEISVAEPQEDKESKEESVKESLEDKYKIPEFEPKVARAGVSYFTRVGNKTESTVSINAQDVKKIEAVDEVPEGTEVVDGVNLVGDLAPEVEEQLKSVAEPAKEEEIPTQPATAVETPEETEKVEELAPTEVDNNVSLSGAEEEVEESTEEPDDEETPTDEVIEDTTEKVEDEPTVEKEEKPEEGGSELSKETWDKFVDNVIVPTLVTCIDRFKDYLVTVIAKDLKDSGPTK